MDMSVEELVNKAKNGDDSAFSVLVRRFQDMALATAFGRLGSLENARDAAQEAFLRSYQLLHQLREPGAFPGWFRRIVLTECNRLQRSLSRESLFDDWQHSVMFDEGTEARTNDPETRVVRDFLESLPESERAVLALQYLGGYTQPMIAEFLNLSVPAVKKRAHAGRERIREGIKEMIERTLEGARPSKDDRFTDTIRFFLAIRRGQLDTVKELLASNPSLASATEVWDDDEARQAGHFHATGATALVRAAGQGRTDIVELLCSTGADPNTACSCHGGESPLWAAIASGYLETAELLLKYGADPDRPAFRKTTPLHVAAMRGRSDLLNLLLGVGTNPEPIDEGGRLPADWATLKGHEEVALTLRAKDPGPSTTLTRIPPSRGYVATGIKTLDLFVPIERGSLVRWVTSEGLGQQVIAAELSHNLAANYGAQILWIGFETPTLDEDGLRHLVAEASPKATIRSSLAKLTSPPEQRAEHFRESLAQAAAVSIEHPTVVFVVEDQGHIADVTAGLPSLRDALVVFVLGIPSKGLVDLKEPYSAIIRLNRRLVELGVFPAIDPVASRSQQSSEIQDSRHQHLADQSRSLLERYLEAPEGELTSEEVTRATRLLGFLGQPLHVAEPFGGRPGIPVTIDETLNAVEEIIKARS